MIVAGGITAAAVRCGDCRETHVWIGWQQLARSVARSVHINALLFVTEPGGTRATSTRTLQVVDMDESRMLCRIHEMQVDAFLRERAA